MCNIATKEGLLIQKLNLLGSVKGGVRERGKNWGREGKKRGKGRERKGRERKGRERKGREGKGRGRKGRERKEEKKTSIGDISSPSNCKK